jgi:hypothetical protein
MDRRKALKNLGLLSGSVILFPSCDFSKENVSKVMNNLQVSETQESLMKILAETYIPETDRPGGLSMNLDEFIWVMVDDCLPKDEQDAFMKGLSLFEPTIKELGGESFKNSNQEQRATMLSQMMVQNPVIEIPEEVIRFIEISKSYTVLGFMRSEYIMTEVMPYSLVPGKPPVCRTIDPNGKINIYA